MSGPKYAVPGGHFLHISGASVRYLSLSAMMWPQPLHFHFIFVPFCCPLFFSTAELLPVAAPWTGCSSTPSSDVCVVCFSFAACVAGSALLAISACFSIAGSGALAVAVGESSSERETD